MNLELGIKNRQTGFTLIELLVVVSIIGLLSSIVLFSLNAGRAKARDAKRLTDIRQVATALELYYNECNSYPPLIPVNMSPLHSLASGTSPNCTGGGFGSLTGTVILNPFPQAPLPADGNFCSTTRDIDPGPVVQLVPHNRYVYESADASGNAATAPLPLPSYNLYFCLGDTTGGISGNVLHRMTPGGIR